MDEDPKFKVTIIRDIIVLYENQKGYHIVWIFFVLQNLDMFLHTKNNLNGDSKTHYELTRANLII